MKTSPQQISLFGEERSIASLEDSPANLSVQPENGKAPMMSAIYGLKCSELLTNVGPLGLLVKTLLVSPVWQSNRVLLKWNAKPIWKVKRYTEQWNVTASLCQLVKTSKDLVIQSNRLLFQLRVSTPLTPAHAFSLLPTPMSQGREIPTEEQLQHRKEMYGGEKRGMYLEHYATMDLLPTPRANEVNELNLKNPNIANRNKGNLEEEIAKMVVGMLPTPTSVDWQARGKSENWKGDDLVSTTHTLTNQPGKTSLLNPRFVAEMMGFPPNWTELPFLSGEKKA